MPFNLTAVAAKFKCVKCSAEIESDAINLPEPNYLSDVAADSHNEEYSWAGCESDNICNGFDIKVGVGQADEYVEVKGECKNLQIIEIKN